MQLLATIADYDIILLRYIQHIFLLSLLLDLNEQDLNIDFILNYRLALQYMYKVKCWMKSLKDWCRSFYHAIMMCWMNLKLERTPPPVTHQTGVQGKRRRRSDMKKTQVLTHCTYIKIHSDVLFNHWE